MRYLMYVNVPHEPFNTYVREGTASKRIGRILEETKPEAVYFTEQDGQRGAIAIYNLKNDSEVPLVCEPWFLTFNADCRLRIAMTPEDLRTSGLDDLGKRWR